MTPEEFLGIEPSSQDKMKAFLGISDQQPSLDQFKTNVVKNIGEQFIGDAANTVSKILTAPGRAVQEVYKTAGISKPPPTFMGSTLAALPKSNFDLGIMAGIPLAGEALAPAAKFVSEEVAPPILAGITGTTKAAAKAMINMAKNPYMAKYVDPSTIDTMVSDLSQGLQAIKIQIGRGVGRVVNFIDSKIPKVNSVDLNSIKKDMASELTNRDGKTSPNFGPILDALTPNLGKYVTEEKPIYGFNVNQPPPEIIHGPERLAEGLSATENPFQTFIMKGKEIEPSINVIKTGTEKVVKETPRSLSFGAVQDIKNKLQSMVDYGIQDPSNQKMVFLDDKESAIVKKYATQLKNALQKESKRAGPMASTLYSSMNQKFHDTMVPIEQLQKEFMQANSPGDKLKTIFSKDSTALRNLRIIDAKLPENLQFLDNAEKAFVTSQFSPAVRSIPQTGYLPTIAAGLTGAGAVTFPLQTAAVLAGTSPRLQGPLFRGAMGLMKNEIPSFLKSYGAMLPKGSLFNNQNAPGR